MELRVSSLEIHHLCQAAMEETHKFAFPSVCGIVQETHQPAGERAAVLSPQCTCGIRCWVPTPVTGHIALLPVGSQVEKGREIVGVLPCDKTN